MASSSPSQGFFVTANNVQFDLTARLNTASIHYNRNPQIPLPPLPLLDSPDQTALRIFHEHPDEIETLRQACVAFLNRDQLSLITLIEKVTACSHKLSICIGFGQTREGAERVHSYLIQHEQTQDDLLVHRIMNLLTALWLQR